MPQARFPEHERRLLLATRGLGEVVVRRLEAAGFNSLSLLHALGAEQVLEQAGHGTWHNRRRALARALETAASTMAESVPLAAADAHALRSSRHDALPLHR